jgi:shikimate dehydrogenase
MAGTEPRHETNGSVPAPRPMPAGPTTGFRLAGVIGWPIAQSRSPLIHGHWLREHDIAGAYLPMAVRPDALKAALRGLSALGFAGCNVTLPHKEHAARIVDRLDETARRMGAVNLIVVEADGSLSGFNKDGYGFLESLCQAAPSWHAESGPTLVLGAGGGARSIVVSLLDAGAPTVLVANRTPERAQRLQEEFGALVQPIPWAGREAALEHAHLLVNTTSLGMIGSPPLEMALDRLQPDALVCDIVYNPLESSLLAAARARGNTTVNGLGMLLHQARPAFAAWFGVDPAVTPALRHLVEATIS